MNNALAAGTILFIMILTSLAWKDRTTPYFRKIDEIHTVVTQVPVKQQLERCQSCHTPDRLARHP